MSETIEKNSDERKKIEKFQYTAETSRYAFPLDYPVDNMAEKLYVSRQTVGTYIVKNPLFSRFYQHMRYDGEYTKQGTVKHKVYDGIPVELEYFFEEFFCYAYDCHPKGFKKGKISSAFEEGFCLDLYKKAVNAEKTDNKDNLYLYRKLYENAAFQEILLKEFWDEFRKRCDLLESLTRQLDGDIQIAKLRSVLGILDLEIAVQARRVANLQKGNKKKGGFLDTFPSEVLDTFRGRKITKHNLDDETAKFELPNLTVNHPALGKNKTLKAAFEEVVSKKNGASVVLEDARRVYMEYIRGLQTKTLFQSQCEALQVYLGDFRKPLDVENIKEEIQTVSKVFYGSILRGEPIETGVYYNGLAEDRDQGEKQRFIIDEANYLYSQFAHDYRGYLGMLGPVDWTQDEKNHKINQEVDQIYVTEIKEKMNSVYQERTDRYLASVEFLWEPKCFGEFSFFCEQFDTKFEWISERMARLCKKTYDLFSVEIPYWTDPLYIKCGWKRYHETMKDKEKMQSTVGIHYSDINLLRALFTCKLYVEFKKTCTLVQEHIQYLHEKLYKLEQEQP